MRRALDAPLKELKERREEVEALCAYLGSSCDWLRTAKVIRWQWNGSRGGFFHSATAHMETLGMLLLTNGLPTLRILELAHMSLGDEDVQSLFHGLGQRALLPSLKLLALNGNQIGNAGATALAAALCRGAMPSLQELHLGKNAIGDKGLIALAEPLPQPCCAVPSSEDAA